MGFKSSRIISASVLLLLALLSTGCFSRMIPPPSPEATQSTGPAEGEKAPDEAVEGAEAEIDAEQVAEDAETEEVEVRAGGAPDFNNHNITAVQNGGTSPQLKIEEDVRVTSVQTYHWNDGTGTTPGTISLQGDDGTVYGPFETTGSEGQGGVPNAYWNAEIDIDLPPGSYTVLDSDPGTWAQNAGSGGKGMVRINTEAPSDSGGEEPEEADGADDGDAGGGSDKADAKTPGKPGGPVLGKAAGDVLVSPPDKEASLVTSSWEAIKRLPEAFRGPDRTTSSHGVRRVWEHPQAGTQLKAGTIIRTETGMGVIDLEDGRKFIMKQNSEVSITVNGLRLDSGRGYFLNPKTGERQEVEAGLSKIRVRGTEYAVESDGDSVTVELVEGSVSILPSDGEKEVILEPGQGVTIAIGSAGDVRQIDADDVQSEWVSLEADIPDELTGVLLGPGPGFYALLVLIPLILIGLPVFWLVRRGRRRSTSK